MISLCSRCYCATKTVKGKCGKCGLPKARRRPLVETNPYLRDPVKRRAMFVKTVISSSAVEGVVLMEADLGST